MKNTTLSIFAIFFALTLSKPTLADVYVTLSPGDSYIADINLRTTVTQASLPDSVWYLCGGFKSSCLAHDLPYDEITNNGISFKILTWGIYYSVAKYTYMLSSFGKLCNGFPTVTFPVYDIGCSKLGLGFISDFIKGQRASGDFSIKSVKISAINAKPGNYTQRVYLNKSIYTDSWSVASYEDIHVIVRNTTCSLMNQTINIGTIVPGHSAQKKLDLQLNCNNSVSGASWTYTNVNYKNIDNTNLKNVFLNIENNKNENIKPDVSYYNINELNNLSINVHSTLNAQGGKLNVPLRFTLTYS